MSKMRERLVSIAKAEIGYLEKASNANLENKTANAGRNNFTKYGAWYPMQAQPWCAMFVSWCAEKAGIGPDTIPKHASTGAGVNWFKARGRWRPSGGGYTPVPGDLIYFTQNGSSPVHVGIVCEINGNQVVTVEGNTSTSAGLIDNGGGVAQKSYSMNYTRILGYGEPDYIVKEETMTQEEFNKFAENWISSLNSVPPAPWSAEARKWAEENGYISGNENGEMQYKRFPTREELVQLLYNILGK